jgi:hypothetical protein
MWETFFGFMGRVGIKSKITKTWMWETFFGFMGRVGKKSKITKTWMWETFFYKPHILWRMGPSTPPFCSSSNTKKVHKVLFIPKSCNELEEIIHPIWWRLLENQHSPIWIFETKTSIKAPAMQYRDPFFLFLFEKKLEKKKKKTFLIPKKIQNKFLRGFY